VKDQSFIAVPSERVVEGCLVTISRIKAARAKRDGQIIDEAIAHHAWWAKWYGWLGCRQITRDEAVKWLGGGDAPLSFALHYPSEWHAGQMETARTLLAMAESAPGSVVNVTVEDYRSIFSG
jgi:hypothetical protein